MDGRLAAHMGATSLAQWPVTPHYCELWVSLHSLRYFRQVRFLAKGLQIVAALVRVHCCFPGLPGVMGSTAGTYQLL